jgi:hypothetical protein
MKMILWFFICILKTLWFFVVIFQVIVINIIISFLSKFVYIKDLGLVNVIFKIKLLKNSNSFSLTQSLYFEKLIILMFFMYVVFSIFLLN